MLFCSILLLVVSAHSATLRYSSSSSDETPQVASVIFFFFSFFFRFFFFTRDFCSCHVCSHVSDCLPDVLNVFTEFDSARSVLNSQFSLFLFLFSFSALVVRAVELELAWRRCLIWCLYLTDAALVALFLWPIQFRRDRSVDRIHRL